jgi:hypothetical protein
MGSCGRGVLVLGLPCALQVYNRSTGRRGERPVLNLRLHTLPLLIALCSAVSCSDDDPTYKPKPDTTAPVLLSGPTISDITQHSAIVSWRTDDPSTSVVRLGFGPSALELWGFQVPAKDMSLVREHSILIAS